MSLESILTGFGSMIGQAQANKANQRAAERARKQQYEMIKSLDWEPMYASQTVPQYQKTQSPLARSYIDSLLTGNNPDAIMSFSPNAAMKKAEAQRSKDQMYGTNQELLARQNQIASSNPYTFKTPERKVMGQQNEQAAYVGAHPKAHASGFDQDLYNQLVKNGLVEEGADTSEYAPELAKGLRGALAAGDVEAAKFMLHPTLERPHSIARRRQVKKTNKKAKKLIDKYDGED